MREITIVTTAGRPDQQSEQLAHAVCEQLSVRFEPRKKRSVVKMSKEYEKEKQKIK